MSRSVFFAEEAKNLILEGILNFSHLAFTCLTIHIVISWVGQAYTDSIVQATGNEEMLNDFG